MIDTLLITGCTHGLGYVLALKFAQAGCRVYAVGRHEQSLEKLANISEFIQPIIADIATTQGRQTITRCMDKQRTFSIIHNAAIAQPSQFNSLSESILREHFETNFFAPILITRQLLPMLMRRQRILHISSGAANRALSGLMHYCTTKTALEQATNCLNIELNPQEIYFANLRPGMIDTQMQLNFRSADSHTLPNYEFYIRAKKEKTLINPEIVAEFVVWVMLKTEDTLFSKTLWNVYDETHYKDWLFKDGYKKNLLSD